MQKFVICLNFHMREVRASYIKRYTPSVMVQQFDAAKVCHHHGAALLVTVHLCTPRVSVFRPVAKERLRERSAGLITLAGQCVIPMVTIKHVSMLLLVVMRE
jgi:hypothetical protein